MNDITDGLTDRQVLDVLAANDVIMDEKLDEILEKLSNLGLNFGDGFSEDVIES